MFDWDSENCVRSLDASVRRNELCFRRRRHHIKTFEPHLVEHEHANTHMPLPGTVYGHPQFIQSQEHQPTCLLYLHTQRPPIGSRWQMMWRGEHSSASFHIHSNLTSGATQLGSMCANISERRRFFRTCPALTRNRVKCVFWTI